MMRASEHWPRAYAVSKLRTLTPVRTYHESSALLKSDAHRPEHNVEFNYLVLLGGLRGRTT